MFAMVSICPPEFIGWRFYPQCGGIEWWDLKGDVEYGDTALVN